MKRIVKKLAGTLGVSCILFMHSAWGWAPENACALPYQYACYPMTESYRGFRTKMEACEELLEIKNSRPDNTYYTPPIEVRHSSGLPTDVFQCVGDRYWSHDDQFFERGAYEQVSIKYNCPLVEGITWLASRVMPDGTLACVAAVRKCSIPFSLNGDKTQCEAYCTTGETWDPLAERCIPPPEEQNCKTQGKHPIDFIEGRKYRSESVLSAGVRYPFSLTYFFNNHRNQEKSPIGSKIAVVNSDRYLAATKPPMTTSEYQTLYTNRGIPKGGTVYRESQHYGSVDQYWRHNFDEVLLVQGNQYLYQSAKGEEIVFNGLGSSAAYPSLVLEVLASGEESFSGYKLTNRRIREVRKFDDNGRLMKLERSPQDVLVLTYDSQNHLDRVTNTEGAFIQLAYQDLLTDSVYNVASTVHSYPVSASNNRGESAQITWGKNFQGKTAQFHLITQITEASNSTAQSARTFEYNDSRWLASITDQYFVADLSNSAQKQLVLHFEYDELGRALFSGINGRSSDTVTYIDDNTRVVTNALGKQATYIFADFDGVKRLRNVTGEPTQNCVLSEVSYEYDANGNVSRKVQNGQVTEYQYDSQNREISRTEAAGTPEARTVTTEYHPTLNLPVRITEPGRVEVMIYDGSGRLLSKQINQ